MTLAPATFAEKVIAAHAGRDRVEPGEIVGARVDLVVSEEMSFPDVIAELRELGADRVFDGRRILVVADHETPARSVEAANRMVVTREFCRDQGIEHLLDAGEAGVMHVVIPERGLAAPGELILGYDSHMLTAGGLGALAVGVGATDTAVALAFGEVWLRVPETVRINVSGQPSAWAGPKDVGLWLCGQLGQDACVYQAVEWRGPYVDSLGVDGRLTIANMSIEIGAKTAVVHPDDATLAYVRQRVERSFEVLSSDPDADCAAAHEFDVEGLGPLVALPHSPEQGVPVEDAAGERLDQVFIGTCTNGRLSDLRVAVDVIRGRQVHPETRLLVFPGSPEVYRRALSEGLIEALVEAGALVGPAGCGPCAGIHMGLLADGEVGLATSSRNFPGRMGSGSSQLYLSSPAVAAASAVAGEIASPEVLVGREPAGVSG